MVTKELIIGELFTKHKDKAKKLALEFAHAGLCCLGCSGAMFETIEQGMKAHGKNDKEIEELMVRINNIIEDGKDNNE